MSKFLKFFSTTAVLSVLLLTAVVPAYAFDGRGGDKVTIPASEVIDDDLYVGANEFVLDGTVNGDLISGGQKLTINGTVNGNLIAGGQTVVVNGTDHRRCVGSRLCAAFRRERLSRRRRCRRLGTASSFRRAVRSGATQFWQPGRS